MTIIEHHYIQMHRDALAFNRVLEKLKDPSFPGIQGFRYSK